MRKLAVPIYKSAFQSITLYGILLLLTAPNVEHVVNEKVVEANLRFWDGASGPVKLWHDHW